MKYLLALTSLLMGIFHPISLSAQIIDLDDNTTRAVVIGISDYQDAAIPDLRFADRDAEAFAAWLRSPAGGSLPDKNVTLLANANATAGKFAMALTGLIDDCKPGDYAIIYFSGHGDVETKTVFQLGFLLCHDSPPNNYMAGAFNLVNLQAVISTLAANNVRVLVLTDACRAGKLAGAGVNGPQLTSANLARQFANEMKILSCQPNEFSLEGEQWGGGRGAFSYHLVEGLTGFADRSADGQVSLLEIGRYLEETVTMETAPHPQVPFTVGDRLTSVAHVDANAFASLQKEKSSKQGSFKSTALRSDAMLVGLDSTVLAEYNAFLAALERGELLEPTGRSANDFYERLSKEESLKPLWGLMRRNFAASLLDEVQQALNALLESDPYEINNWRNNPDKYHSYPRLLQRSMELLGEGHYMHRSLLAKKRYFEGYLFARKTVDLSEGAERDSLRRIAKGKYLEAAKLEATAAYIYQAIASLHYFTSPPQTDSVLAWNSLASQWSPQWLLPYLDNAYEVSRSASNVAEAERWMKKALAVDSSSYVVLERLSWLYQWQGKAQESLDLCDRMIALKPDLFNAYSTKGVTHNLRCEYAEAEAAFKHSFALDSSYGNWAYLHTVLLLVATKRQAQAVRLSEKIWDDSLSNAYYKAQVASYLVVHSAVARQDINAGFWAERATSQRLSPVTDAMAYLGHGMSLLQAGKDEQGRLLLMKSLETNLEPDGHQVAARVYLGVIEDRKGNMALADSIFREAFGHISPNALDHMFTLAECYLIYGDFLLRQHRYDEARRHFRLAEEYQPRCYQAQYGYALLAAAYKQPGEALDYLEKALDYWYPAAQPILEEPLFKKIRKTKRFEALMKKHFPDQAKD